MKSTRMKVVAVLALFSTPYTVQSQQQFPTKPIRMIIGFTAGSEVDFNGRMVAQEMSEHWGQRAVADNRPGAGSTVAAAIVAAAASDGYTLFFNSASHAAAPGLYLKAPFDTLRDFAGVSQVTSSPNVLVVAPTQSFKSMKELIAFAKQGTVQVTYSSGGIGSGAHITGEMLKLAAGLNVLHVPYKGGPEVLIDVITGRVHYTFNPIGSSLPLIKDKRLLPLAVTTLVRSPVLPDVPTVSEAAIADFEFDQWNGLFAPAKTPRAIVNQLSREVARILALPNIRERLAVRGTVPKPSTPEEFDRFVRAEVEKVTRVIKAGGIKVE